MCKVFMIAGVKSTTVDKAWKFAKAIAKPMSRANTDGIGYAAITAEGNVFGERWLKNDHMFKTKVSEADKKIVNMFDGAIDGKVEDIDYNSFGTVEPDKLVAMTLHTRMATSAKGMNNVHPFVEGNTSLIHNGVIRNVDEFKLTRSTCDSEAILISYLEKEISKNPENIEAAAKMLRGYYACGVLTNSEEGPILDIFKSNARLHVTFVEELETFVVSTDDDDIKDTCKLLGYSHGQIFSILSGRFIRVDAVTGKEKKIVKFDPSTEWTSYSGTNHGWSNNSNPNKATGTDTKTTTTTPSSSTEQSKSKSSNVLPYGKRRENTPITDQMMEYFKGSPVITKLNEREIQEKIMEHERLIGGSMW